MSRNSPGSQLWCWETPEGKASRTRNNPFGQQYVDEVIGKNFAFCGLPPVCPRHRKARHPRPSTLGAIQRFGRGQRRCGSWKAKLNEERFTSNCLFLYLSRHDSISIFAMAAAPTCRSFTRGQKLWRQNDSAQVPVTFVMAGPKLAHSAGKEAVIGNPTTAIVTQEDGTTIAVPMDELRPRD